MQDDYEQRVREESLSVLDSLVTRGFAVMTRVVLGVEVGVKTYTSADLRSIYTRSEVPFVDVAHALYSVGAFVVYDSALPDAWLSAVVEVLETAPDIVRKAILITHRRLGRAESKALGLFDDYVASRESRHLWQLHKAAGGRPYAVHGEPMLGSVPTSRIMLEWAAQNANQDKRDDVENLWTMVRMLAQVTRPEVSRKIPKTYYVTGSKAVQNYIIPSIETDADLVQQLEGVVSGTEDEHDRRIREYEEQEILPKLEERKRLETARRAEAARAEREGEPNVRSRVVYPARVVKGRR